MKETVVRLVPKDRYENIKDDKGVIEQLTDEITKRISEKIIKIVESYGEIIIDKPVLTVSEDKLPHNVEYREAFSWEPLVRCKDCRYWTTETEPIGIEWEPGEIAHYCCLTNSITRTSDFCNCGERGDYVTH